jgi:hypothetical protein
MLVLVTSNCHNRLWVHSRVQPCVRPMHPNYRTKSLRVSYTLIENEGLSTFSLVPLAHDCESSAPFDHSDGFLGIPMILSKRNDDAGQFFFSLCGSHGVLLILMIHYHKHCILFHAHVGVNFKAPSYAKTGYNVCFSSNNASIIEKIHVEVNFEFDAPTKSLRK